MRWLTPALAALLVLLQYPLWLGEGGWLRVWQSQRELAGQQAIVRQLRARNEALSVEIIDLREARDALEERAREQLGMVRDGEILVRVIPAGHGKT